VLVLLAMLGCGGVIFVGLFISFSCVQFWTADASEFANAFTYGGASLLQYPLTVFPKQLALGLTFVLPIAFANWYPSLFILDHRDTTGLPHWLELTSPAAAVVMTVVTSVVWRLGVRHYTSTGS
jgi:ABC-2 type transport system permease protein